MLECQVCHGATYTGETRVNISCQTAGCHVDRTGARKSPEACNTCHGDFSAPARDTSTFAPPKGVKGETSTSYRGVGAHQVHLKGGAVSGGFDCTECHTVPKTFFETGHVDTDLPAEVFFNGPLGRLRSAVTPAPVYSSQDLSCANTFCHGNWRLRRSASPYAFVYTDSIMVGANKTVGWTAGAADGACGTCHGIPPVGHIASTLSACVNCHPGVVNSAGQIIDKTKHINGKVDAFGSERNF